MKYTLELENDILWNIIPLVAFLKNNEGKDIELTVNQESHCLRFCRVYELLDIFEFNSVTIFTRNALEYHDKYRIMNNNCSCSWNYWLDNGATYFNQKTDYRWNGNKLFGCFYGRPTAARLGIASHLYKEYVNKSLLCIKFKNINEDDRKLFELERLYSWHPEMLHLLSNLIDNNINQYYNFPAYNYASGDYDFNHPLNELYSDIFVDIVVEAHNLGNSFYPTEKIARAILCKKPFIVMATKNYLYYLKQIGFKTFTDLWDENYDFLYGKDRYYAIIQLIDKLASMSQNEIQQLHEKSQDIVEHNYNLLTSLSFSKLIVRKHD